MKKTQRLYLKWQEAAFKEVTLFHTLCKMGETDAGHDVVKEQWKIATDTRIAVKSSFDLASNPR